jgi:hypothetical protein
MKAGEKYIYKDYGDNEWVMTYTGIRKHMKEGWGEGKYAEIFKGENGETFYMNDYAVGTMKLLKN